LSQLIRRPNKIEYKWLVFLATAIGTFVSVLDQSSVNLALPRIAEHFSASIPAVQWVALGYGLTTGSLLMPMGRLSDVIGRKKVYVAGFVIFTAGALLTGSSNSLNLVVTFKIFQAVGAAMVQGTSMAIVTSAFDVSERGKIIGLFMTVVGAGAIAGPVVGGAVVGMFGWRSVFFMGVPFGVASILSAFVVFKEERISGSVTGDRKPGFDWPGAALSSLTLIVFLLVMTNAYRIGWTSPIVLIGFAATVALAASFIWWEGRAKDPMLALDLFRHKIFALGSSASFLTFLAGTSIFFMMPFYLQKVLGYTPGQTGLLIAPTAIAFATLGPISGRLADRYGWQRFTIAGALMIAAGLLMLSRVNENTPIWLVLAILTTQGIGMGTFFSPNATAVLSVVDRSRYGVATAYLNMVRNAANVTGIAIATTIVTLVMASQGYPPSLDAVTAGPEGEGVRLAFAAGLRMAFLIMFSFAAAALVLSAVRVRRPERAAVASPTRPVPTQDHPSDGT
jgi:EmrB/QacA subfamily drug resistance transporter